MDPDFNKYDLTHRVTHHPLMSDKELDEVFIEAHRAFFTFEHMAKVFKRMVAQKNGMRFTTLYMLMAYREGLRLHHVAYAEFGILRIVRRRQRRYGLPLESPIVFYPRLAWRLARKATAYCVTYARLRISLAVAWRAWEKQDIYPYTDEALVEASGANDALVAQTLARSTPYAQRRQQKRNAAEPTL